MKTLNITIRTIIVFLLAGALFISCEWADPDACGTLVIALPGSDSARAVDANDPSFLNYIRGLYFSVKCSNEADEIITREFKYGTKAASISLSPGAWYVTVYVLDKEKEEPVVGEGTTEEPVIIEAGKIKTLDTIEIYIPANSTISKFTLKIGTTSFPGAINNENDTIVVIVPSGTNISNMSFDVEPNDKISHTPNDAALNFTGDKSYTFTVQPEYGTIREYKVSVKVANTSNEITKFTITNPVVAEGTINNDNTIVVTVPSGTNISNMTFNAVHNGDNISHTPNDAALNFDENESYTFTVQSEYGTTRVYTVTAEVEAEQPGGTWPAPEEWAEYGLTNSLTQPGQTIVAYVIEGWDSFNLSPEAKKDLGSLPERMQSSIEDMDFLMVKLEFKNANNKGAKDDIYTNDPISLYKQIEGNNFEKTANINWNSASLERWDIFKNDDSDTVVNLYMNYAGNYIIILAVKEYSWIEIKWGDYGLENFEMPDGARVVYVSYDKDESNKDNSKLQTDYGMRTYTNKTFPEFFAVVFLDENESIYEQLKKVSPFSSANNNDITDNDNEKYITIVDRQDGTYTRAIDLYKSKKQAYKDYTLITVRQGVKTSSSQSAYW